jgi:hypothetical protein
LAAQSGVINRPRLLPYFAGEFVGVAAGGREDALAAEGVEVRLIEDRARGTRDYTRCSQVVGGVIHDVAGRITACNSLAPEENIFVSEIAGKIGLH